MAIWLYTALLTQSMNHSINHCDDDSLPWWFRLVVIVPIMVVFFHIFIKYREECKKEEMEKKRIEEERERHYDYLSLSDEQCRILEAKTAKHDKAS